MTIEDLCRIHGISRQAYYQWERREIKIRYKEEIVLQLVTERRKRQPKIGGRKLYWILKGNFERLGFKLGRDGFFSILRDNGLLIEKKKKYIKTTNSAHRFRIYTNLIKEIKIIRINQVIVSDITYIETEDGYVYLALITEMYSRMIIGYDVSESLSIESSLRALRHAIKKIKATKGMIHHSDRGIQYCSNDYTKLLKRRGIKISMAEKGNPYENAVAERVNGILKIEFLLEQRFRTKDQARRFVREAIKIYNEERPHMSIGYEIPAERYSRGKAA